VRNYVPSYHWVVKRGWNVGECVARSDDLEACRSARVAAGRTRSAELRRLKPGAHLKRSGVTAQRISDWRPGRR
jgi:hypothetical protein